MDNGIPQNGEGVDTAVLIPDGLADAGKYALLEDGTFTNTASANVTVLGQKLWKTMPASYPAADLPEVTFTLQQTLGTETRDIATLTIRNWNLPLEDGAYHFGFAYTGENVVSMNADGTLSIEPAPGNENAQPLPKYDENGQRYTYTLKETCHHPEKRHQLQAGLPRSGDQHLPGGKRLPEHPGRPVGEEVPGAAHR